MHKVWMRFTFLVGWVVILSGCTLLTHKQQITALKNLAKEQEELEKYVNQQEILFDNLKNDIRDQRLRRGTPKEEILALYGEPIFCKASRDQDRRVETCFWRHPTQYFSSDLIFLNFDQDQKLFSWEIKSP